MREPKALCDSSSKQYSGYLDIADDAHLFYWFFESRSKHPEKDPLVLWLNGGASSSPVSSSSPSPPPVLSCSPFPSFTCRD